MFPVNKTSSELDEANEALESLYNDEDDYLDDEDEDEDSLFDEEDEDDKKGDLDPKMEKIITIGAIAATVIIAIIIIVAIASVTGAFKKDKKTTEEPTVTEEIITMIDVVGMEEAEATKALDEAGIAYEIEREYSDKFEEGLVVSQSILEGQTVDEDEKVKIVISKGIEEADVPDVVGKTPDEARTLLTAAGFVVEEDEEYDDEVEAGKIISQTPSGETKAAKGSTVTIVVSKGKEVKVATVPDLKKKTVTEAESALSEVKLKLGNVTQEYSDTIAEGKVIRQSIAAGTEVKEETAVDITISKGKEPKVKTYTATFSGSISNNGYDFEEGEAVYVKLTLKVGDATYEIISDYYQENSFPIQLSGLPAIEGLTSKNGTLSYSVQDENGTNITGSFSSSGKATIKEVEQ